MCIHSGRDSCLSSTKAPEPAVKANVINTDNKIWKVGQLRFEGLTVQANESGKKKSTKRQTAPLENSREMTHWWSELNCRVD